ncbi:MAG: NUDIX hydrolase [Candidatus Dadabacteria bacterium]|nr:MAG: NUDIX hydrolase [Candidatus Dadabacteria bacterium]
MSTRNPWKKLASRQVYSNPWMTVREDSVIRPDGQEGIYGVVETKLATGVVALDDDDRIYLVGQYRYTVDKYSWEIIEGAARDGESPLEAAKRELKEEAGISAADWKLLCPEFHTSNCFTDERAVIFLARNITEGQANPDPTEVLQIKKTTLDDCLNMIRNGEITDAMSIIALYAIKLGI